MGHAVEERWILTIFADVEANRLPQQFAVVRFVVCPLPFDFTALLAETVSCVSTRAVSAMSHQPMDPLGSRATCVHAGSTLPVNCRHGCQYVDFITWSWRMKM